MIFAGTCLGDAPIFILVLILFLIANLYIDQGSTFTSTVTVEDANDNLVNITNYTTRGQVRKSYTSTTATNFTASVTGVANGEVTISMTAANTANMTAGRYLYDLVITSPISVKTRVIEGIVVVLPGVTQI